MLLTILVVLAILFFIFDAFHLFKNLGVSWTPLGFACVTAAAFIGVFGSLFK